MIIESQITFQVEAEDADAGKEGDIFYFFVGASNSAGFGIDHKTGVIFVNERLDRESQNRYVLTVLAKNRGSIRGDDIDEAQVIIQVEDGNDPPVFRRDFYLADVSEVRLVSLLRCFTAQQSFGRYRLNGANI